ncbi:MAG TPA: hypothetical protein DEE98_05025 [Elusimicrobia bacterium]|nr:MAG: hypothetical protein A2278_04700 [Elusimicrobia bacterium RIFOXYA12_FULL_49_49]OGS06056.1 MAG: hypothetical protein A2204_04110 [Elusimicrobia bacterium RIFOXYA1_FULL_47_7]OGS11685.1 MAG: hypothetical protein A2386_06600 [Elusimicrobia bacterium RIFOXYB1_FULL_48_9]OGS14654.1 MAG: hypothetical protein A2251_09140 [Elusimicrobia bacterium RIFOXYA2_FULL_47_53]OGS25693.1 MAG: hypothetical protein A2339_06450 [Elusimicrobia bacterium RIFOXYB12_FULL_50_12]OGS31745.1 MAG: hypothetical protein
MLVIIAQNNGFVKTTGRPSYNEIDISNHVLPVIPEFLCRESNVANARNMFSCRTAFVAGLLTQHPVLTFFGRPKKVNKERRRLTISASSWKSALIRADIRPREPFAKVF